MVMLWIVTIDGTWWVSGTLWQIAPWGGCKYSPYPVELETERGWDTRLVHWSSGPAFRDLLPLVALTFSLFYNFPRQSHQLGKTWKDMVLRNIVATDHKVSMPWSSQFCRKAQSSKQRERLSTSHVVMREETAGVRSQVKPSDEAWVYGSIAVKTEGSVPFYPHKVQLG